MYDYDLVVIGSGPGGQKAAIAGAKLGKSVADGSAPAPEEAGTEHFDPEDGRIRAQL
jgi:thioredoxin reductase